MARTERSAATHGASAERDGLSTTAQQGGAREEGDATVQQLLQQRISELELVAGGGGDRQAAVKRKKQLRTVAKLCADGSLSAEEKLLQLQAHYVAQVDERLKADRELQSLRKEHATACKDRDLSQGELQKSNAVKDMLQELCRKLQKENRRVLEASQKLATAEAAMRCESRTQVDATLASISTKLEAQAAASSALAVENDELRRKLLEALSSIDIREQHATCQAKSRSLELQLAAARQRQAEAAQAQAQAQLAAVTAAAEGQERGAQQELAACTVALAEYKQTILKSSEVLTMMKEQLDERTAAVEKLMRERRKLREQRERAASLTATLLKDSAALKQQDEDMKRLRVQNSALEGLCRRLREGVAGHDALVADSKEDPVSGTQTPVAVEPAALRGRVQE